MIASVSMNMPAISSTMFRMSRIAHGSLVMEVSRAVTFCGASSMPRIQPNGAAHAAITRIVAVSLAVASRMAGSLAKDSVR